MQIKEIAKLKDWEQAWNHSAQKPVIIFKHSTTCPISAGASQEYSSFTKSADESVNCYIVNVIENKDVSNRIQTDTNVKHESPQIFLISNQDIVWHTSHVQITKGNIEEAIENKL
ncbi:bacillithiol system redox-active protein YtxJ [Virgibacillus necropolis]|uniref:General stress protein n=1 Tax=Virgibacillus necropolis TaxID=163877 RepID=A0A221M7B2_9BACI|nr:bacillithiol system redox-active protein YtxJ [Virgibacillus necropolis]ASN03535.1 general stress protein [Virgibacillus necropolis]